MGGLRRTALWRTGTVSGAIEKSGGRERKQTHRGDRTDSPGLNAENRFGWKYLALLGIVREEGRAAPASAGVNYWGLDFRRK